MSIHVKEETLHLYEAETPSDLFSVILGTKSISKILLTVGAAQDL